MQDVDLFLCHLVSCIHIICIALWSVCRNSWMHGKLEFIWQVCPWVVVLWWYGVLGGVCFVWIMGRVGLSRFILWVHLAISWINVCRKKGSCLCRLSWIMVFLLMKFPIRWAYVCCVVVNCVAIYWQGYASRCIVILG